MTFAADFLIDWERQYPEQNFIFFLALQTTEIMIGGEEGGGGWKQSNPANFSWQMYSGFGIFFHFRAFLKPCLQNNSPR